VGKKIIDSISFSFIMVVTPADFYIAIYSIKALKKIIGIKNIKIKIFANGLTRLQENKISFIIRKWNNVTLDSNRKYIAQNKKEIQSEIGRTFYDENGRPELREGLCEPCGSVWERELLKFNSDFVGMIDADFEILDSTFFLKMINDLNKNPNIGIYSSDFTEKTEYNNTYTTLDNTYSSSKTILMPRYHTWFCVYKRELLNIDSDFSYLEKKKGNILYTYDHTAKLQEKFINNYNVESRYSGLETYWCYLHYGAFAKNQTLKGFTLFFYRILRLGKHNSFKHIINLPILNRKLYWICRRIYLKLNYKKYDRERMKHAWQ